MDHELKQRLIGAVVVTALAAIFIPMLFDDPVDTSGKEVTELAIPPTPAQVAPETGQNLPQNKEQVINRSDTDLKATEVEEDAQGTTFNSQTITDPASVEQSTAGNAINNKATNPGVTEEPTVNSIDDNAASQTGKTGLDTGYVGGTTEPKNTKSNAVEPSEPEKITPEPVTPTVKPVTRSIIADKPKEVNTQHKDKPTEKPKHVVKSDGNKSNKSGSKLVRYSIQAGSFNKKENAEVLAAKLRKQGIPTTIVSKGDYYRVKVGPSLDKAKAKEMKSKLDKLNINGLLTSE